MQDIISDLDAERKHIDMRPRLGADYTTNPTCNLTAHAIGINDIRGATLSLLTADFQTHTVARLPGLRLVGGATDSFLFGKWNRIVAVQPKNRCALTLPGHGGEIVPGKLIDHIDAMKDRAIGKPIRPVQLDIDPTMACPSHCSFCFSRPYRETRRNELIMSRELLFYAIASWIERGVRVVRFDGGGDPLTHPHCIDAIELAARQGASTALLTAADLLRPEHLPRLVAARTYVRISLNAATERTRSVLHRPIKASFGIDRIFGTIEQLATLRACALGASTRSRMLLGATFLVHPLNISEIVLAACRARDAGLDHISFRVVLGAKHALQFTEREISTAAAAFLEVKEMQTPVFQVFTPSRPLTDTGYFPLDYFDSCVSCLHRVLIEVGRNSNEAAQIPCGRYRGSGFTATASNQENVLNTFTTESDCRRPWPSSVTLAKISRYPSTCGDCLDRSANLMLHGILAALRQDPNTRFFRAQELPA